MAVPGNHHLKCRSVMECVMNATIGGWDRMDETRRALRRNVSGFEARRNNSSSALAGWLACTDPPAAAGAVS